MPGHIELESQLAYVTFGGMVKPDAQLHESWNFEVVFFTSFYIFRDYI